MGDITLSGTVNVVEMVLGPDGNLWAADANGKVWSVSVDTASGTPYALSGSEPLSICSGLDDNLWVADTLQNAVWKVTTAGSGTLYAVLSGSPVSICAGPDGNLWVTEGFGSHVWKVSTGGLLLATYTLAGAQLREIVAGPDGNLWAVDYDGGSSGKLWKITPGGSTTSYSLGVSSGNNFNVCVGPDNNLWVVSNSNPSLLHQVTTAGVVTTYTLAFPVTAQDICAGADGNLWVADGTNNVYQFDTRGNVLATFNLGNEISGGFAFPWVPTVIVPGLGLAVWVAKYFSSSADNHTVERFPTPIPFIAGTFQTLFAPPRPRTLSAPARLRTLAAPPRPRTFDAPARLRTLKAPARPRTLEAPADG